MGSTEFREVALGEVASFRNGKALTSFLVAPSGKYPVFGSNGTLGHTDELLNPSPVVVIGRVGAFCGSVHRVNGPSWVTDNAIVVEPLPGTDLDFLYYRLASLELSRTAIGSAQPLVTQAGLKALRTRWPPLDTQRAVSRVLRSLDDKIELNRRMSETLEATARAIFKSWFVDFDPVRGTASLPDDVRRLFPDRLVDSPLGPVPEEWTVEPLGRVVSLSRKSIDPREHPDEEFDHFSIPAFDDGRMSSVEVGATIRSNKLTVGADDVLLSKLNPRFPRVWMPFPSRRRAIASTEFLVARSRPGFTRAYVYSLLSSEGFLARLQSLVTGTSGSHQRVKPADFLAMITVIPPPKVIARFDKIVAPTFEQQEVLLEESRALAETRDYLLPQLVSGAVRVNSGEQDAVPAGSREGFGRL